MENQNEEFPNEQGENKGVIRKLLDVLSLGRSPDTTEELEHEIQELLEEGEEQGLITSLEEKMINSIFNFRDTLAVEIMTPAVEIISADITTPVSELIDLVLEHGFTRTPLFKGNSDRIVGILHVKDLLRMCAGTQKDETGLEECMNDVYFILEKKPIVDLLKEFQKTKTHMAIVTDEFGTVRGLITLEDVLEEIVGEIDDEFDVDESQIEQIDEKTILLQARMDVEVVEEHCGVGLPEGPYESIGGYIIHKLGRLASAGDCVEENGLRLDVKSANSRQIKTVQITRLEGFDQ